MSRILLTAGLLIGLGGLVACQAPSPPAPAPTAQTRSPVSGDPGPNPVGRAANTTNSDRQPRGTTDGNQPDRAASGGGAR